MALEKGIKDLTLSQANIIAEIFNITLTELISGEKISDVKVSIKNTKEDKTNRLKNIWFGRGREIKERGYRRILKVVGVTK